MTTSTEVSKSKALFTLLDIEDLCSRARAAGAIGSETFRIHQTKGDRPFDRDYHTVSVTITENSRVDTY